MLPTLAVLLIAGCKPRSTASAEPGALDLSSGDRALQDKLQPMIKCSNHALSVYARLQPDYATRVQQLENPTAGVGHGNEPYISFQLSPSEQGNEYAKQCIAALNRAAAASPSVPSVDGPASDAAAAMQAILAPGNEMDAYLEQKAYLNDNFAQGKQLDAQIRPLLNRLAADNSTLTATMQQQEAGLHQRELDAIERRDGQNLS